MQTLYFNLADFAQKVVFSHSLTPYKTLLALIDN